jgi:hypothetical protein
MRGRPRKYDKTIPRHIDQRKLPTGAYWDSRDQVWYTKLPSSGGKSQRRRIAGPTATLAELSRVLDQLNSADNTGTIAWLHTQLAGDETLKIPPQLDWKELKPLSRDDYTACLSVLARLDTDLGITADKLVVNRLRKVDVQAIVDKIATTRPSSANHVKRYLGRLFTWGMQRGKITDRTNPAHGVKQAKERGANGMPPAAIMDRMIAYARERGARKARTKGSCSPYVWIVMCLAFRCRLRGVEVLMLTDADKLPDGILGARRKGSLDTITRWSPELEAAWEAAVQIRKAVFTKLAAKSGYIVPIKAQDRPLLVSEKGEALVTLDENGDPLERSTWDSAWQRFMAMAIKDGVISPEQRFTLHGLKHRGITDTQGGKAAKKAGGGHKTDAMSNLYDHEIPVVDQAGGRADG